MYVDGQVAVAPSATAAAGGGSAKQPQKKKRKPAAEEEPQSVADTFLAKFGMSVRPEDAQKYRGGAPGEELFSLVHAHIFARSFVTAKFGCCLSLCVALCG